MYGTVARLQARAGSQAQIEALAREMREVEIPGPWISCKMCSPMGADSAC